MKKLCQSWSPTSIFVWLITVFTCLFCSVWGGCWVPIMDLLPYRYPQQLTILEFTTNLESNSAGYRCIIGCKKCYMQSVVCKCHKRHNGLLFTFHYTQQELFSLSYIIVFFIDMCLPIWLVRFTLRPCMKKIPILNVCCKNAESFF